MSARARSSIGSSASVILPAADLKIYLDASIEERAARRSEERGVNPASPAGEAILAELRRRDGIDSGRPVAPMRAAVDARIVRTDGNSFEETVDAVTDLIAAAEQAAESRPRQPTSTASRARG
jgi:cytidylate kinase